MILCQEAHHLQFENYAFFDEKYGATIAGKDFCKQPEGAAELGFRLNWCHSERASPVRYAYTMIPDKGGYRILGESGSDENNLSFVCFEAGQGEIWGKTKGHEISPSQILSLSLANNRKIQENLNLALFLAEIRDSDFYAK